MSDYGGGLSGGPDNPAGTLAAALEVGRALRDAGDPAGAAERFGAALAAARRLGDPLGEADALNLQAGILGLLGDYPRALEGLGRALELVNRVPGQEVRRANVLSNVGALHTALGNYPQALEALQRAHDLLRAADPASRSAASNLISLGSVYEALGEQSKAGDFFVRAAHAARTAGDPLTAAAALNNLANHYVSARSWDEAVVAFQEALELARGAGATEYEVDNLGGLGEVYAALGDLEQAAEAHTLALAAARAVGYREGECDALLNLGRDHLAAGRPERASGALGEALLLAREAGLQPPVCRAHELLAAAHEASGDFQAALAHHRAFHKAERAVFSAENERRTRHLSVQFDLERAEHEAERYRLRAEVTQRARDEAEATVRARTRELEEAQLEIVTRLAVAAEYRDDNTGEHTRRVGRNAAAIATALGWPEPEVGLIHAAARLHDVGKIGVSDAVLHKPGQLTGPERDLMQTHAEIGARILAGGRSRLLRLAEEIALAHHERWDGLGYPHGLAGAAIPVSARVVAVADVLDALTQARPYKGAWPLARALEELEAQSGSRFDPAVVAACAPLCRPGGELFAAYAASEEGPGQALGGFPEQAST